VNGKLTSAADRDKPGAQTGAVKAFSSSKNAEVRGRLNTRSDVGPRVEAHPSVIVSVNAALKIPLLCWDRENGNFVIRRLLDALSEQGAVLKFNVEIVPVGSIADCPVCGWIHDMGFTQIKPENQRQIQLAGVLPDIVKLVHSAHEKGLQALSTKDDSLTRTCGGYRHPCKAFGDLKRGREYKLLFDTSRRGFIALRGALGIIRSKTERPSE
jgi:hypothetical protein